MYNNNQKKVTVYRFDVFKGEIEANGKMAREALAKLEAENGNL